MALGKVVDRNADTGAKECRNEVKMLDHPPDTLFRYFRSDFRQRLTGRILDIFHTQTMEGSKNERRNRIGKCIFACALSSSPIGFSKICSPVNIDWKRRALSTWDWAGKLITERRNDPVFQVQWYLSITQGTWIYIFFFWSKIEGALLKNIVFHIEKRSVWTKWRSD